MSSSAPLLKPRRRSPASLILDSFGISQAKLADALGISPTSLSRMLRGGQPRPIAFEAALRAAVGFDGARRVLVAIETERHR